MLGLVAIASLEYMPCLVCPGKVVVLTSFHALAFEPQKEALPSSRTLRSLGRTIHLLTLKSSSGKNLHKVKCHWGGEGHAVRKQVKRTQENREAIGRCNSLGSSCYSQPTKNLHTAME